MAVYSTIDGDVLDLVVWRLTGGRGPDVLAVVLAANPHIRAMPAHLPAGTKITIPDLPSKATTQPLSLWD